MLESDSSAKNKVTETSFSSRVYKGDTLTCIVLLVTLNFAEKWKFHLDVLAEQLFLAESNDNGLTRNSLPGTNDFLPLSLIYERS